MVCADESANSLMGLISYLMSMIGKAVFISTAEYYWSTCWDSQTGCWCNCYQRFMAHSELVNILYLVRCRIYIVSWYYIFDTIGRQINQRNLLWRNLAFRCLQKKNKLEPWSRVYYIVQQPITKHSNLHWIDKLQNVWLRYLFDNALLKATIDISKFAELAFHTNLTVPINRISMPCLTFNCVAKAPITFRQRCRD